MSSVARTQNRAAGVKNASDVFGLQQSRLLRLEETAEAFFDPQHLPTDVVSGAENGADHRIQSRAVSSAGQDADSFGLSHLMARRGLAIKRDNGARDKLDLRLAELRIER